MEYDSDNDCKVEYLEHEHQDKFIDLDIRRIRRRLNSLRQVTDIQTQLYNGINALCIFLLNLGTRWK